MRSLLLASWLRSYQTPVPLIGLGGGESAGEEENLEVPPGGIRATGCLREKPIRAGGAAATVVIGEIVMMAIEDGVLDETGAIDPARLDAIGRLGGENYCRTNELFKLARAPSR